MMARAKDEEFLQKLKQTVNNRQRMEEVKQKDREMRHSMMIRKIENQRQARLDNLPGNKRKAHSGIPNASRSTPGTTSQTFTANLEYQ
jgi:hypothetical protein